MKAILESTIKRQRNHPIRSNRPPGFAWGDLFPANGRARCFRCHFPWGDQGTPRHGHTIWYSAGRGQFVLCEACWPKTTFLERVRAHAFAVRENARIAGERRPYLRMRWPGHSGLTGREREWLLILDALRAQRPRPSVEGQEQEENREIQEEDIA